ncbi:MAG TPA: c-type cytochrome [Thermoanaerobaculia bacterium]|jgi:cytochrome c2
MKRLAVLLFVLALACKSREPQQIGDADHGKQLIDKYGCAACHVIPQIEGPKGMVGPPLEHIASRQILAGKLPNTPQNMMAWLQNPQLVDPNNSMPNLGVTPADARDITAYLETLK